MSASVILSDISWSTPDGERLLSGLDLSFAAHRTGLVGRNGVGKSTLLRLVSGDLRPHSGKVTVNGTLGVLHQTILPTANATVGDAFGVNRALAVLNRAERGEAGDEELAVADWTLRSRLASSLHRIGLDAAPETPLATLSGGQRTRVGLAALIFSAPDFILLDEPTNNLDNDGRKAVLDLLANWRTGAIVVSHDRELLEAMDTIVELTSLGATRFGGNWSHYRERKNVTVAAVQHELAVAETRVAELAKRTQASAERKARKDRVGQQRRDKGDMPRIHLNSLRDRSEGTAGDSARLAERRRSKALDEAGAARARVEVLQPLSVMVSSTGLPVGKTVLRIDAVCFGFDPDRPLISDLSLAITGPERIAVTGPNGCGKTTLLSLVTGQLQPWTGTVRVMTDFALLDQRLSLLDPSASVRDSFRRINPRADENACRAALARFMFRAETALRTVASLSDGQVLRAGLACVLGGATPPSLLILDEPTNYLDIDSIEAMEAGLRAYDGALLVVSHDEAFLRAIGISRRLELSATPRT